MQSSHAHGHNSPCAGRLGNDCVLIRAATRQVSAEKLVHGTVYRTKVCRLISKINSPGVPVRSACCYFRPILSILITLRLLRACNKSSNSDTSSSPFLRRPGRLFCEQQPIDRFSKSFKSARQITCALGLLNRARYNHQAITFAPPPPVRSANNSFEVFRSSRCSIPVPVFLSFSSVS